MLKLSLYGKSCWGEYPVVDINLNDVNIAKGLVLGDQITVVEVPQPFLLSTNVLNVSVLNSKMINDQSVIAILSGLEIYEVESTHFLLPQAEEIFMPTIGKYTNIPKPIQLKSHIDEIRFWDLWDKIEFTKEKLIKGVHNENNLWATYNSEEDEFYIDGIKANPLDDFHDMDHDKLLVNIDGFICWKEYELTLQDNPHTPQ